MAVLIQASLNYCHTNYSRSKCFNLPQTSRPHKWQLVWLPSFLAMLFGYLSLNKHRLVLMQICFYGTFLFGLGPILSTIVLNGDKIMQQLSAIDSKKSARKNTLASSSTHFYGVPIKVIWCMLLVICLQIHLFSMYFSRVLIKLWSEESAAKRKKQ